MSGALAAVIAVLAVALALVLAMRARQRAKESGEEIKVTRIGDRLRALEAKKTQYAMLTADMLARTPDEALLEAVLCNLWAKMAPDLSDAPAVMAALSPERQHVYALYAVTGGAAQEGFSALKAGADGAFLPVAEAALDLLGLAHSSAALARAVQADTDEAADACDEPYAEAFEAEHGKAAMAAYIRANPQAFCDAQ